MRVPLLHLSTASGSSSLMKLLPLLLMVQLWGEPGARGRHEGRARTGGGGNIATATAASSPSWGPGTYIDIPSRIHPRVGSVPRCRAQLLEKPVPSLHQLLHLSASPALPLCLFASSSLACLLLTPCTPIASLLLPKEGATVPLTCCAVLEHLAILGLDLPFPLAYPFPFV